MMLLQATSLSHCTLSFSKNLSGSLFSSLQARIVLVAAAALGFLVALYAVCKFYLKKVNARPLPINQAASHNRVPTSSSGAFAASQRSAEILVSFPPELINKIANHEDLTLNLRAVAKPFNRAFEERVFDPVLLNYQASPLLAERLQDIQRDHPTYSMNQQCQALYRRIIDEVSLLEGGEDIRKEMLAKYGEAFARERLHHLEKWLQAVNLLKVFERISIDVPQAKVFLDQIRSKDVLLQAEDVQQWMMAHPQLLSVIGYFNLSKQNLTRLPKEIGRLIGLRYLHLEQNNLTTLPAEIGNLRQLVNIYISQNRIQKLPAEIRNWDGLEYLDLSQNQLASLPIGIGNLRQLTSIDLSQNHIQGLPAEIGNWDRLQRFDLHQNQLTSLPTGIGNLRQLTSINLRQNRIQDLPAEIRNWDRLEYLNLSQNQLTSLPEIGELRQLENLCLSKNRLTALPEIKELKKLNFLSLDDNQFTAIPEGLDKLFNLKRLSLFSNRIACFPKEIGLLKNRWGVGQYEIIP